MDDETLRMRMVTEQIERRGVRSEPVLAAMRRVPRHEFVPARSRASAYEDHPLPIGEGQTISQPYIVALMAEAMNVAPGDTVLEVGTGSGYASAVLAELGAVVVTVERRADLAANARLALSRLGYDTVTVVTGDGTRGWAAAGPYDAIAAAAATPAVPRAWGDQLVTGGRLVVPLGVSGWGQQLRRGIKQPDGEFEWHDLGGVTFVPLISDQE